MLEVLVHALHVEVVVHLLRLLLLLLLRLLLRLLDGLLLLLHLLGLLHCLLLLLEAHVDREVLGHAQGMVRVLVHLVVLVHLMMVVQLLQSVVHVVLRPVVVLLGVALHDRAPAPSPHHAAIIFVYVLV